MCESPAQPKGVGFVVCQISSKCTVHHRTDTRTGLWYMIIGRLRCFFSAWQWHWQWHGYWHKLHTVDWQYKLSTCCTCSPVVQTRESPAQPKGVGFVVCQIASKCTVHHRTDLRIGLWYMIIGRLRCFFSAWQWHWQWHGYWHKLHTVDWQYKLTTCCTCSPHVYRRSEWIKTNSGTPHQWRPFLT
jgi:hypothetical protein